MTRGQGTGRIDRGAVNGAAKNGAQSGDQVDEQPPGAEPDDDEIRVLHYPADGDGTGSPEAVGHESDAGVAAPPGADPGSHEPDQVLDADEQADEEADEAEPAEPSEPDPGYDGPATDGSRDAAARTLVVAGMGATASKALALREEPPRDDERRGWPLPVVFGVGLLAGALVLALIWGTTVLVGNNDNSSAATNALPVADQPTVKGTETSRPSSAPASPVSAAAAAPVSKADACAQVVAAQGKALKAAKPAMDQWAVHIGAMNKLVVGAITLAQANAFWAQTRLGAMTKIQQFQVADDHARSMTVACPPAALVDHAAAGCARTAERQSAALKEARTAVHTWRHHVQDMEMLRMGHLSPAAATKMWLASWHAGVDQLRAYQRATQGLGAGTCAT